MLHLSLAFETIVLKCMTKHFGCIDGAFGFQTQEPKYPLMGSKSISRGKYKEACVATSGVGVGDVDCNNWARNDRKYALCEFPNVN